MHQEDFVRTLNPNKLKEQKALDESLKAITMLRAIV